MKLEFGAYAQTHEAHDNDMRPRTIGAICLGPSGNEQGGHYFLSLRTGRRLLRNHWTALPMPDDAILRVSQLGREQNMPKTLTFADRYGHEFPDIEQEIDDDHDSSYSPTTTYSDYESDMSDSSSTSSQSSGSDGSMPGDDPDEHASIHTRGTTGVDSPAGAGILEEEHQITPVDNITIQGVPMPGESNEAGVLGDATQWDASTPDPDDQPDASLDNQLDADANDTSHDDHRNEDEDSIADHRSDDEDTNETDGAADSGAGGDTDPNHTVTDHEHAMDQKYGVRDHGINLRPRRPRSYKHRFGDDSDGDGEDDMVQFEMWADMMLTEQMSLKRGLKLFGKDGADAVVSEMQQLDYRNVIEPVARNDLTSEQRRSALTYLMFLKQKRCGRIKARGCADGRKQRLYKSRYETSSPTVCTESVFLTSVVDASEQRHIVTVDIPGAFMHSDMDELLHMRLEGALAELLIRVNPAKYGPHTSTEKGKPVIYVRLNKALYGTLQAALLFWQNLSGFLVEEMGFTLNPYDHCVANKTISGSQCTVIWHVDDLKISHVRKDALATVVQGLNKKYGKETPITVHYGSVHDYLGMTIDFSTVGKVHFKMTDYVANLLDEAQEDAIIGTSVTPAAAHLFDVNDKAEKLSPIKADRYHHLTAKLLYLCKRSRPDIQTAVAFLCRRVKQPDTDDWKKLSRCIKYLRETKDLYLTLEALPGVKLHWWVDASYAVHKDMRSHTGGTLSLGKGSVYSTSTRQKINTKSSTEAELVAVDDCMPMIIWMRNFLMAQNLNVEDNLVFQDNQSAMLLERNGRASSGRRTRHINIRYFFIADRIKNGEVRVEYCPTGDMLGDFFTKPTQGALFRRFRQRVLNLPDDTITPDVDTSQECVGTWSDVVRGDVTTSVDDCESTRM